MDLIAGIARNTMLTYLNQAVRVNADGTIYEVDASLIEAALTQALESGVLSRGYISPPTATTPLVVVDRTNNVVTSNRIHVRVRAIPLGYLRAIDLDLGFAPTALVGA
jgi:hypothetical protein